jgi:hypothetical protein
MKKPMLSAREHECPGCQGTGFPPVVEPRPDFRIYPLQCEECLGKGHISDTAN